MNRMTRKAVIGELRELKHMFQRNYGKYPTCLEEAIDYIYQTPQWTPVSEGLPEEADGTVLVCMPNEFPYNEQEPFINAKHNQRVETATYSQYSDTWYFAMGAMSETRPIAWMPLPKPYEEEQE